MMLTENHNLVDGDGPLFTYGHGSALVSPPRNLITPGSFIQTNRSTVEEEEDHVDAHRRSYFPGSPQASTDPMSSTTTHTSNTQKCSLTSTEMVAHTPTQHLHAHPHKHPPTASALVCWLRRQTPWYMDELRHRALLKPIPMPPSIVDFIHRNLFINNIITDNNNNRMVYVWPEEMLTTPTSASPQIEVPFYRMMVTSADERKTQQLNDSRQLRRQRKSSHAPIVVKVCREELALCTLAITRRAYAEKLVEQRVLFYQKARDVDEAMVSDEDVAQLGEPLVRCTTSSQESPPTLAPCASTQPSMFHTYRPICYEELAISPRLLSRQRRAEMRAMLHQRSSSEDLYGCPVRYERCTSTTA